MYLKKVKYLILIFAICTSCSTVKIDSNNIFLLYISKTENLGTYIIHNTNYENYKIHPDNIWGTIEINNGMFSYDHHFYTYNCCVHGKGTPNLDDDFDIDSMYSIISYKNIDIDSLWKEAKNYKIINTKKAGDIKVLKIDAELCFCKPYFFYEYVEKAVVIKNFNSVKDLTKKDLANLKKLFNRIDN